MVLSQYIYWFRCAVATIQFSVYVVPHYYYITCSHIKVLAVCSTMWVVAGYALLLFVLFSAQINFSEWKIGYKTGMNNSL